MSGWEMCSREMVAGKCAAGKCPQLLNHGAIKKAGKFKFLGSQRLAMDLLGLAPAPVYIWAEVLPSGRHQEAKTKS